MDPKIVEQIRKHPDFYMLVQKRRVFALKLTIAMLVVYFGFIAILAFAPEMLATTLSDDTVITVGIPVGIGIILFAFILTGIYVKKANSEFDAMTNGIKETIGEC